MIVGIDYGTSNSLVTSIDPKRKKAISFSQGKSPHPSVVWFDGGRFIVGKLAKEQLRKGLETPNGKFIKSPKALLGNQMPARMGGRDYSPAQITAEVLKFLREHTANNTNGQLFTEAVITIPITLDGHGRKALREAANHAGFGVVQLVHEPLAALYGYFRKNQEMQAELDRLENRVVLVFDWGGGTLDMTLVRVKEGNLSQIHNHGMDMVGGDVFDRAIQVYLIKEFFTNMAGADATCILPGRESALLEQCELAKINLSTNQETAIYVKDFARIGGKNLTLEVSVNRALIEKATSHLVDQAILHLKALLSEAGIQDTGIALCLSTGGMSLMPAIYERLVEIFDAVRTPKPSEVGSATLISEGAAWIAHDKTRLTLSKPLELGLASGQYLPLLAEGIVLPQRNNHVRFDPWTFYCTDPTDGKAKFLLTRPQWPGHTTSYDARNHYAEILLDVDQMDRRIFQRLLLHLEIDPNLVITATCESIGMDYKVWSSTTTKIQNLEFGLRIPTAGLKGRASGIETPYSSPSTEPKARGGVMLRSNVTNQEYNWADVPGDIVEKFNPIYFHRNMPGPGTWEGQRRMKIQLEEREYYLPLTRPFGSTL